jgi:hypothetical protein
MRACILNPRCPGDVQRRRDLLLLAVMSLRDEFVTESPEYCAINAFVDSLT